MPKVQLTHLRNLSDTADRVVADMTNSERTDVTLDV